MKKYKIYSIIFFQIFCLIFSPVIFKSSFLNAEESSRFENKALFEEEGGKKLPNPGKIIIVAPKEKPIPYKSPESDQSWAAKNKWWLLLGVAVLAGGAAAAGGGGGGGGGGSSSPAQETGSASISW